MRVFGRRLFVVAYLLSIVWLSGAVHAQISQPTTGAPTTPAQGQKPLPWKSVATPQGVLSMNTYATRIRAFGTLASFDVTKQTIEEILNNTVRANGGTVSSTILSQKDRYYAIHVLEYGDTPAMVKSNSWYLYRHDISFQGFTSQRIYGSKNIVVLFLHLNAKGLESTGVTALAASQKSAFAGGLLYDNDSRNHLQIQALGDGAVDSAFTQVHYEAAVVKKTAANIHKRERRKPTRQRCGIERRGKILVGR